jgi:hypothetical protein
MFLIEKKYVKAWLVQLDNETKRKVIEMIEAFPFEMSGLHTQAALKILPLVSYNNIILGMDWLATHKEKLKFYEKFLEYEDEEVNAKVLQGIRNLISFSKISALQLKKVSWKGRPLHVIQVLNPREGKELKVEYHLVLWEFKDVFPKEVLGLPPKRDFDFSIYLVLGEIPTSKVPYRMSTPELVEMKVQLKDMLYIG